MSIHTKPPQCFHIKLTNIDVFFGILCHHKIQIKSTYLIERIKRVLSFTPISEKREASAYLCPSEVVQAHLASI